MIGVALDVNDRRRHVLGAITEGVDDDAAGHRAVRARAAGLGRTSNLELAHLGARTLQVESQRNPTRHRSPELQEGPSIHGTPPTFFAACARASILVNAIPSR